MENDVLSRPDTTGITVSDNSWRGKSGVLEHHKCGGRVA